MKKQFPLVVMTFSILLFSCNKNEDFIESNTSSKKIFATKSERLEYGAKHLKVISHEIAKLATNLEFRNFVHEKAKLKFDGEYNVLIQDLMRDPKWKNKMLTPKLVEGLKAFRDLEGTNQYPQIYIPRLQFLAENSGSKPIVETEEIAEPIFGFCLSDENLDPTINFELLPGYEFDDSDSSFDRIASITENFANNNETWIINLNESVNGDGYFGFAPQLPEDPWGVNYTSGGGSSGGGNVTPPEDPTYVEREPYVNTSGLPVTNCKIDQMVIKQNKESWFSGASEVHIKAVLTTHNNRPKGILPPDLDRGFIEYHSDRDADDYCGFFIRKFYRDEIAGKASLTVDFKLQEVWPYGDISAPAFYDFVIFEYDGWPANKNSYAMFRKNDYRIPFDRTNLSFYWMNYRSQQRTDDVAWSSPYIIETLCNTSFLLTTSHPHFHQSASINWAGAEINTKTY